MHSTSSNAIERRGVNLAPAGEVVAGMSLNGREYIYFAYYFYFTHRSLRAQQVSEGQ